VNDLLNLLKGVAPTLATAVAGPLGGAAVSALAAKFGVSDSVEAVAKAIAADPAKLQEIELEYAKLDMANTADARKMNSDIQNSTAASWMSKNIAYCIDIAIVTSTVGLTALLMTSSVPQENKELALMAFGSLVTLCGTVVNFHRGSSQGSKDKSAKA
jgi:hypothetical protein